MKNLKISKKLAVSFSIVVFVMIVTIFTGISGLIKMGNQFQDFYEDAYELEEATSEMNLSLQSAAKFVGYAIMTEDLDKTGQYIDMAQEELNSIKEGSAYLKENFTGDAQLVTLFDETMKSSMQHKEVVFEQARKGENAVAIKEFFTGYEEHIEEAMNHLAKISEYSRQQARDSYNAVHNLRRNTVIVMIAMAVGAVLLVIGSIQYLSRIINKPLKEIEHAAKEMAQGSLNVHVDYVSKDELGSLAESIRILTVGIKNIVDDLSYGLGEMAQGNFTVKSRAEKNYIGDYIPIRESMYGIINQLSGSLAQIDQSSTQVNAGAEQVSDAAQSLSQGATEQASAIEELSTTISEISSQVNLNAQHARTAKELSAQASVSLSSGNQKMLQMTNAMEEITNTSNEIGKIIRTIDDIAFQTNILALNAAVEAARAGSAGKGFAVVADEVRNLAGKSAEAAKNTTALIESAIEAIMAGRKIAEETAGAISTVVEGSKEVDTIIGKIAEASNEQANAISQVTIGVDQIASVVQTNSATSQQTAAASEELNGQAETLRKLVAKFRLKDVSALYIPEDILPNVQAGHLSVEKGVSKY